MSNKHDANVRKSTLVNFQIGLVASLLFTYVMFEVYTAAPMVKPNDDNLIVDEPKVEWDGRFTVYQEPETKVVAVKRAKPTVDPQKFEIIDDNAKIKDAGEEFKNDPSLDSAPIDPGEIVDVPEEKPVDKLPFIAVEDVPVFPGCETLSTNKEKATCFSEKVAKIVSRRFNTGLGERYGLTGMQRIYTQFEVDTDGLISNIRVRAPHPKLEKEAERVINLFPQMIPGKQRGTPVKVTYQLPIVFKIQ